jgi:hypothetical protein
MTASLKFSLGALLALAIATPAFAQDERKPTSGATSTGSTATPRGGTSAGSTSGGGSTMSGGDARGGSAVSRLEREPQTATRRPSSETSGGAQPPAYSRPRGDRAVRGQAVPRGANPLPSRGSDGAYIPYYGYYGYNGYGSYYGSPYRYGYYPIYTGLGYFYYDPFWSYYAPVYGGYYGGGYGRLNDRDDRDYNLGSLRLKVEPAHGEVFVDGLYRGIVDEFDGVFQRLKLEAGPHRIEVRAPGLTPLVFDVLVTPGETTTYRGRLR